MENSKAFAVVLTIGLVAFAALEKPLLALGVDQVLRPGQGIIDMVNSDSQIALPHGLAGSLFLLLTFETGAGRAHRTRIPGSPLDESPYRTLIAALAGALVTILSVCTIGVIPRLLWLLAGLLSALAYWNRSYNPDWPPVTPRAPPDRETERHDQQPRKAAACNPTARRSGAL